MRRIRRCKLSSSFWLLGSRIAEGKRGVELDPLALVINADLGMNYYYARRYDDAIRDAAIAEYEKARALNVDPSVLGYLAHATSRRRAL
jgi:tetratricopeptide (TPR) repeat protein